MKKKKKRSTVYKKNNEKKDLSYREMIEIVEMSSSEIDIATQQHKLIMEEMSKIYKKIIEEHRQYQEILIRRKILDTLLEDENSNIENIRKKYKNILELYKF